MSKHLITIRPGQRWKDKDRSRRTGKDRIIEVMEVHDGARNGDDTYAIVRNVNGKGSPTTISLHRFAKSKLFELVLLSPKEEADIKKAVENEKAMAHAGVIGQPTRLDDGASP
jgi:hypothetical protein